jgi:hypothetical protein
MRELSTLKTRVEALPGLTVTATLFPALKTGLQWAEIRARSTTHSLVIFTIDNTGDPPNCRGGDITTDILEMLGEIERWRTE